VLGCAGEGQQQFNRAIDRPKYVATVFLQTMTELNGAESVEDRTVAIRKIVLKMVQ
jgi:hypothetical protein